MTKFYLYRRSINRIKKLAFVAVFTPFLMTRNIFTSFLSLTVSVYVRGICGKWSGNYRKRRRWRECSLYLLLVLLMSLSQIHEAVFVQK